jgi:Cytochrome C oxidase, cbb3-type, subunit III
MPRSQRSQRSQTCQGIVPPLVGLAVLIAALAGGSVAYAQSADDIAAGRQLFLQKGNCQACHGWAGDGRKMDDQMPDGANLREIPLDRQVFIMTVKCGRPGTGMPAFDRLAYSDGRCFGLKQNDLRARGLEMPDPPATLAANEVERLADFVFAKVVGKGPIDRAGCVEFWGSEVEICKELKK